MVLRRYLVLANLLALALCLFIQPARAVIRDGGIDPANLGKGDWVYYLSALTSGMGGNVPSVTNIASFMAYEKSQGIRYIIVKAASGSVLYPSDASPQFTTSLVNAAHAAGLLIFGYNRSGQGGVDVAGEVAVADFVFNQGADGFVWDAESEWEVSAVPDNLNLAWQICSQTRSNWPNKFLAHAPFDIISYHSSFPYKEFGYWSDAVMPQIYHFNRTNIKSRPSGNINWADANWKSWQDGLVGQSSVINGQTIYWTNSIKPLAPVNHVYGPNPPNSGVSEIPPSHVMEFVDLLSCDPNTVTAGGYKGASFWRADLHGSAQWVNIKAATIGNFPGIVNNIVIDSPNAASVGAWNSVQTFSNATFYGDGSGTDTNSFGTNYLTKGQGAGAAYMQFTPNIITPGDYDVYQWHPTVVAASAGVPHVIAYNGGTATVYANQQINPGMWTLLGRFNFAAGTAGNIRVLDNFAETGAVAIVDAIKFVFAVVAPPLPAAPSGLTATTASSSQLNLSWTDNTTNETSFVVARGTISGGPYTDIATVAANSTSYANTGLTPNTTYFYVARATAIEGSSTNSAQAGATTSSGPATDIILDNTDAEVTFGGAWQTGIMSGDKYLGDYRFASTAAGGTLTATYRPDIGTTGSYDIYIWYPRGSNHATNAPWTIFYDGGSTNVAVNQSLNGGGWRLIAGALPFQAGTNGYVSLSNDTGYSGKVVLADGVRFSFLVPINTSPGITAQPLSRTVRVGSNVTFTVTPTGSPSPSYQWRFNGTNLSGANASSYTRNSAQAYDAGNYSVVVTNAAGGVTSSNAVLTVNPWLPVQFQSVTRLNDGRVQLVITGNSNATLWVDHAPSLPPIWLELTNLFNPSGTVTVTNDGLTNGNRRFYRARQ